MQRRLCPDTGNPTICRYALGICYPSTFGMYERAAVAASRRVDYGFVALIVSDVASMKQCSALP